MKKKRYSIKRRRDCWTVYKDGKPVRETRIIRDGMSITDIIDLPTKEDAQRYMERREEEDLKEKEK